MDNRKACRVSMIRRPDISFEARIEDWEIDSRPIGRISEPKVFNETLNESFEEYGERFRCVAKQERMRVLLQDFPMFGTMEMQDVSRQRILRLINESDIIATINPPPRIVAYIRTLITNVGNLRAVICFSERNHLQEAEELKKLTHMTVLKASPQKKGQLFLSTHEVHSVTIPKMFVEDLGNPTGVSYAISQALHFPNCEPIRVSPTQL